MKMWIATNSLVLLFSALAFSEQQGEKECYFRAQKELRKDDQFIYSEKDAPDLMEKALRMEVGRSQNFFYRLGDAILFSHEHPYRLDKIIVVCSDKIKALNGRMDAKMARDSLKMNGSWEEYIIVPKESHMKPDLSPNEWAVVDRNALIRDLRASRLQAILRTGEGEGKYVVTLNDLREKDDKDTHTISLTYHSKDPFNGYKALGEINGFLDFETITLPLDKSPAEKDIADLYEKIFTLFNLPRDSYNYPSNAIYANELYEVGESELPLNDLKKSLNELKSYLGEHTDKCKGAKLSRLYDLEEEKEKISVKNLVKYRGNIQFFSNTLEKRGVDAECLGQARNLIIKADEEIKQHKIMVFSRKLDELLRLQEASTTEISQPQKKRLKTLPQ